MSVIMIKKVFSIENFREGGGIHLPGGNLVLWTQLINRDSKNRT